MHEKGEHRHKVKRIDSAKPKVKDWKNFTQKERLKTNTFLIEGEHLAEEALKSKGTVKEILVNDESAIPRSGHEHPVLRAERRRVFSRDGNRNAAADRRGLPYAG